VMVQETGLGGKAIELFRPMMAGLRSQLSDMSTQKRTNLGETGDARD
jgi:hypothetical protein